MDPAPEGENPHQECLLAMGLLPAAAVGRGEACDEASRSGGFLDPAAILRGWDRNGGFYSQNSRHSIEVSVTGIPDSCHAHAVLENILPTVKSWRGAVVKV